MSVDFRAELNDEQYRAVTAGSGPLLVLAAAGTGKTRTLVYRVAYLVEQGVSPDRILLLTFTNRAANEMLERATGLVGSGIGGLWGGTFHHMSNRLLRRHAGALGIETNYTILDRDDSKSILTNCIKDMGLRAKDFPKRDVLLELFGAQINTGRPLDELVDERFVELVVDPEDVAKVHRLYNEQKKRLNALDFDDLLGECRRLFVEHPDILRRYQQQFLYVLVDEYQDTNQVQAEIVDAVAKGHNNLLVVGDDFQSIYSWRGADYRNILSFPDRYADTQIFKLETNYRSVPEILSVANACIAGNPDQFQKTLRPTREPFKRPRVAFVRQGNHQARYVVGEIERLIRDGRPQQDITVLYRAHFHAMELQLELSRSGIPYVITSGVRFFEQAHVKDALSLLRVVTGYTDGLAFSRLLGLLPGVGPRTAVKLWAKLGSRFTASDAAQCELVEKGLRVGAREGWASMRRLFELNAETQGVHASTLLDMFVDQFYLRYAEATFDNAQRRIEDVQEMARYTEQFESVQHFLNEVALLSNLDAEAEHVHGDNDASVRLSTVHQAKGLEWGAVIILWAVDGMFPSSRSLAESPEAEAEERRLFYVALTRAKDELVFCVPELRRMRDGGVFYCDPSRFIQEIDSNLLHAVRPSYH